MINIAVFASGNGSNAVNLVKSFNSGSRIRVALCLTDKENAPVIEKMKELGVETAYFPRSVWRENPDEILATLRSHDIQIIALAGFLCYVSEKIVAAYEGRILNIHPSLLPAYGGKGMHGSKVHEAVIAAGETKSGATVHVVTDKVDMGPIVGSKEVPVLPDDTPETLEARVHQAEYELYPAVIAKMAREMGQEAADANGDAVAKENAEPEKPESALPEPPEIPKSVDDEWAETLGVANNVPKIPAQPKQQPGQPFAYGAGTFGGVAGAFGGSAPFGQGPAAPFAPRMQMAAGMQRREPMPPTWLVWSVIMTILCCFIPGIVAIVYSSKVSGRYFAGDIEGAKRASRNAEIWIIISFVLGVISNTLYLPLAIAGIL